MKVVGIRAKDVKSVDTRGVLDDFHDARVRLSCRKSHDKEAALAVVGVKLSQSIERYRYLRWLRLCNSLIRNQRLSRLLQHRPGRFEFLAQALNNQQPASDSGKGS